MYGVNRYNEYLKEALEFKPQESVKSKREHRKSMK